MPLTVPKNTLVKKPLQYFSETQLLMSTPCTRQLIDVHEKYGASAISLEEVPKEKVERCGIIKGMEVEKDVYKIEKLVEKPLAHQAPSNTQSWDDMSRARYL